MRGRVPFGFTCPAPRRYRHQWYWDSCFHAIVWRHFDVARAREELRTLLRAEHRDGLVPHTAFWGDPVRWRRAPLYATAGMRTCQATESIGPPLLAWAWELVAQRSDDEPGFATEALPGLERHYDWLDRERDLDGDGLLTTILPDESGLDDSPQYDRIYGRLAHYRPGYFWLIERSRRLGFSAARIAERYDEHAEDVLVNVLYARALRSLVRLGGGERFAQRAERCERALVERSYDERRALFFDLAGPDERPSRVNSWSALSPILLESVPEDVKRTVIERHVLHPRRYQAPFGLPSVAIEEPGFNPRFDRFKCWRGPSWVVTSWLLVPVLRELGYVEDAERILDSHLASIARDGFREYVNPLTGQGIGERNFGMSTLVVDLVDQRSPALHTPLAAPR